MTPDGRPAAPAGLRPETAVICAGRPGHAAGGPLNVPVVLASNFQAGAMAAPGTGQDSRAYSRTDATPGWEALEMAVGQVEGGHAVAFSSGMAAIARCITRSPVSVPGSLPSSPLPGGPGTPACLLAFLASSWARPRTPTAAGPCGHLDSPGSSGTVGQQGAELAGLLEPRAVEPGEPLEGRPAEPGAAAEGRIAEPGLARRSSR